ncbi:MAG: hypothetical protein SWO11_00965 [Thermodesulfobacteriota bacterium]|nr:hypothetical protein [Thermodesulfobacteriota bacterium]
MNHILNFCIKQKGSDAYIEIFGGLTPEKVYDVYTCIREVLSPKCKYFTIDLKNINQFTYLGIFLLSSVLRELMKTVQSVGVLGIPDDHQNNFRNLGITCIS